MRVRCLARRSLTAAVRPAGGIQQRFGDVGCLCHMLSSESKVREVPSSPLPHQCSAERSHRFLLQKRLHSCCMPRCGKLQLWSWLREDGQVGKFLSFCALSKRPCFRDLSWGELGFRDPKSCSPVKCSMPSLEVSVVGIARAEQKAGSQAK